MSYKTYKQADSRWGSKNYNGSSSMATAGCGPTSVAMLAYAVDGKTDPWDVALYMKKNGYAIRNNGTAWSGIPAAMKHFGLENVKKIDVSSSMANVWGYLKDGYCAVFLFRAGVRGGVCWTTAGHYVAVTDYKKKNNRHYLYTRDSGGRNHTGWYSYEGTMRGLISQVWVGKVPAKAPKKDSGKYPGKLPAKVVRKGDKGEHVEDLQRFLNWALQGAFATLKYDKLKVDGHAGGKTCGAIKLFKDINHMNVNTTFGTTCIKKAKKMHMFPARKAVNWAVATARDNRFTYGEGSRAHNYGCYYCGTNITGKKHAKKGSKWEKTYCCNPFIHAAYAHGTKNARMLRACRAGGGGGTSPGTWTRYGCWKKIGRCSQVSFGALKIGDIIMKKGHVWMYTGKDGIVEASGGGFTASSIAHKDGAKNRYNSYRHLSTAYVCRYRG